MYFYQEREDHVSFHDHYKIKTYFDWKCSIMPWADDRIRATYTIGLNNLTSIGRIYNESHF